MNQKLRAILLFSVVGVLLAVAGCSTDPEVAKQRHFQNGERYLAEGKFAEAAIELENAIQIDPRFGQAYLRLGEVREKQEDGPKALAAYIRAADLLPDNNEAHLRAANYLIAARRFEDARTTAAKVVAREPRNIEALILVGNASAGLNDWDRAISELQAAQKLDASDSRIYNNLGWFEALRGRSEQAESVFRGAVELAPKSAAAHMALANYLTATGRRAEAERSLRTAISVEPTHVPALRALGWLLTMTNRAGEAEPFFVAAAQHDPQPGSKLLLADSYVWSGRDADATRVLEQLKEDKTTAEPAMARLALIAYRVGNRAGAEGLVKALLALNPRNVDARLLSIRLAQDDGKLSEALSAAEKLTNDLPQLAEAHFLRGRILASLRRYDEGIKAFSEVIRLNPRAVTARLYLARLHLESGQVAAARQNADEVLVVAPGNPAARLVIVQTLQGRDQPAADRLLGELVKNYPDWAAVHIQAARQAVSRSDWTRARQALDRLEVLMPGSQETLEGRLAVDIGTKNFDSAFRLLKTRLDANPKDERLLLVAGQAYLAAGELARAEAALKQLLANNPANSDVYFQLGQVYTSSGRLEEAERQFVKLAEHEGSREYGLTLAAVLAHAQGKLDVAQQRYEKVVAANPQAAVAANNLAWLYAEKGTNLDVALNLAQSAHRAEPDDVNFLDTLGVVLSKKGLWDMAITELRDAARRSDNPTIYLHLAQALAGKGSDAEARETARKALAIDPNFPEADEARRLVGSKPAAANREKGD